MIAFAAARQTAIVPGDGETGIQFNEALRSLAVFDARKSQVVELRFFGGLNVEETAEALSVSVETVHRDWRLAKSWLLRSLRGEKPDES
jgi:RNA polymerase sigma-70 factor, ECF subfamily